MKMRTMKKIAVVAMAIAVMAVALAACESGENSNDQETGTDSEPSRERFPSFEGKTLEGSDINSGVFAQNSVTVVNFWFSDCPPCLAELGELNEVNEELKKYGGEVIGVNTYTFGGDEKAIKEAAGILNQKKASYRNLWVSKDSDLAKLTKEIVGYPTTYVVDRNGTIVGEPILGASITRH
ncbi:TlpA disulfide reductase family protein [Eubacterium sp. AB3007]|uniref:TlpA disulfide reductase family protein n=1 Tax=Eubacterium sp. AB3007 TaxID=1392487 RepID=UPI0009DFBAF7|nr:TlpA disulfide reductase family protein [Eubacterium sp. AB3007]